MGEVTQEFKEESKDLVEKFSHQQHYEEYKDDKTVQQVNLLEEVAEKERDYVEAEDNSENNDDRVEEPAEEYVSGQQDESEREAIVFDPGNEERSEATDSNERNVSHVNDTVSADELDEPFRKNTIKSDEKEATMESNVLVEDLDEAEPKEKNEKEATDDGGVNTSVNVKEQDNAVFEFFD